MGQQRNKSWSSLQIYLGLQQQAENVHLTCRVHMDYSDPTSEVSHYEGHCETTAALCVGE